VRVGRSALDPDAIRLIEQHNPDVDFDWTRILKGEGEPAMPPPRRERPPPGMPPPAASRVPEPVLRETLEEPESLGEVELEPSVTQGLLAEESPALQALEEEKPPTAAHARLGSEGVSRLRARFAEVVARIDEREPDSSRRAELKSQADRLNPDTWVTSDEVAAGLEQYEIVFESLRATIGGQRTRRRRGPRRGPEDGESGVSRDRQDDVGGGESEPPTSPDSPGGEGD